MPKRSKFPPAGFRKFSVSHLAPGRQVFTLLAKVIFLIVLTSYPSYAAEINVEKENYQHREKVNVYYTLAPKENINLEVSALTGSKHTYSSRVHREETGYGWLTAELRGGRGYMDFRVDNGGRGVGEDFYRVRHKDKVPVPGAISLHGGPQFNYGDKITFNVNVPGDKVHADPPWEKNFRYYVYYDFMPTAVTGTSYGTEVISRSETQIQQANTMLDWTGDQYDRPKFAPGFYRIKLTEWDHTLDSKLFTVILKPIPNAFSLLKKEYKVGESPGIRVNRGLINPNIRYNVAVYRKHEDGRLMPHGIMRMLDKEDSKQFFSVFEYAGNYLLRFYVEIYPFQYILDQVAFKVTGQQPPPQDGYMFISVGNEPVFRQDEKITVTYFLPKKPKRGRKIDLYRKHEFDREKRKTARENDPVGQGDEKVISWDAKIGKKQAFIIEDELPPGEYSIRFFEDPQKDIYRSEQTNFRVVAPVNSAVLDLGKKEFLWDEVIPVNITLPEGVTADFRHLFLQLVRKGGYMPGCSIQEDKIIKEYIKLDGKTYHELKFEDPPGNYILKLYDGKDWNDKSPMIGQAEFKVKTTNAAGAIQFTRNKAVEPYETLDVSVSVPGSIPPEALLDTEIMFNYLGYNSPGGGFIPASSGFSADLQWNGNEGSVQVMAPEAPGFYELWLYKRHNNCGPYDPCIVMDKVPFEVKDPRSPFKTEFGPGGKPIYNLGDHFPFPPIGEYLDAETCGGPFSMEALKEKMEITFVKWLNGNYVEVQPPIKFGDGFYVQGKLEDDAARESYIITLTTPEGDTQDVALYPLEDDKKIVRSDRVYLIWHPKEEVSE